MPLWAGIAPTERAEAVVRRFVLDRENLRSPHGLYSLAPCEPAFQIFSNYNPSDWLGPVWVISTRYHRNMIKTLPTPRIFLTAFITLTVCMVSTVLQSQIPPAARKPVDPSEVHSWVPKMLERMNRGLAEHKLTLGTQSTLDMTATLRTAVDRLGEDKTDEDLQVLTDAVDNLTKELIAISKQKEWSRIQRMQLSAALAKISPEYPLAEKKIPATIPPPPAMGD